MVQPDQRFQADIAGFGHESGTETDHQIAHSGVGFAEVENSSAKPVQAWTSSNTSGRSTRGSRAVTCLRSSIRLGGSTNLSRFDTISSSRPGGPSKRTAALVDRLASVCRYAMWSYWVQVMIA